MSTQLFSLENTFENEVSNKVTIKNIPKKFNALCSAKISLIEPTSNLWQQSFPIKQDGDFTNTSLDSNESIYSEVFGSFMVNTFINITVPSATKTEPIYLMFYLLHYYNGSYYSYSYNIFKVDSSEPQTFTFTNYCQNTWAQLYTHFRIDDPLLNYPDYTLNYMKASYVSIDKIKADAGQFYT